MPLVLSAMTLSWHSGQIHILRERVPSLARGLGRALETLVKEYEAKKALQMKMDNEDCDVCKQMD